jgi:hypothetical protein
MQKDPADRFPTMDAFCEELKACLHELQETRVSAPVTRAPVRRRRGGGPWPVVVALAGLLGVGAVLYVLIHGPGAPSLSLGGHSHHGGGSGAGTAPALHAVRAFDPYGTNGENDAKAHLATDGVASTSWSTEQYYDAPSLNKPGVGLVLDAGSQAQVHEVGIATATPGFTAEIRAGDSASGPFPTTVAPSQQVGRTATFIISSPRKFRYYLIWITRLGNGYQTAQINEVTDQ